jgi:hypothetical protein
MLSNPQTYPSHEYLTIKGTSENDVPRASLETYNFPDTVITTIPSNIIVAVENFRRISTDLERGLGLFMTPDTLSINYGGSSNLFSSLSTFDLFKLSSKNGLTIPWSVAKHSGFPIIISGDDLPSVNENSVIGSAINTNLSATISGKHYADLNAIINLIPKLVIQNEEYLTLSSDGSSDVSKITKIPKESIERALVDEVTLRKSKKINKVLGGRADVLVGSGIFSSILNGVKNIAKYALGNPGKVVDFAKNAYNTITGGTSEIIAGGTAESIAGGTNNNYDKMALARQAKMDKKKKTEESTSWRC